MKIDGTDSSVVLKLIHIETQAVVVLPLTTIPVNKSSELIFTVPLPSFPAPTRSAS
jgi:hypothetical protein